MKSLRPTSLTNFLLNILSLITGFLNEPKANYLVIQGTASSGHPLKIILPTNYPMAPPKIYFDMQMQ